jgi:CRP-like cAMP-binding protein
VTGNDAARSDWTEQIEANQILAAAGPRTLERLRSDLDAVELPLGRVLYEVDEPLTHVVFPTLGVVSIVSDVDGEVFENATVGHEGMVGLPAVLGGQPPVDRALVQVSGHGFRLPVEALVAYSRSDERLERVLRTYGQVFVGQVARNGACDRAHTIRRRCARWLLLTSDRMRSARFELKQEFLAQMLNVRRASVSQAAAALAELRCIEYRRGVITIVDRDALEAASCSCYGAMRSLFGRLAVDNLSGQDT